MQVEIASYLLSQVSVYAMIYAKVLDNSTSKLSAFCFDTCTQT